MTVVASTVPLASLSSWIVQPAKPASEPFKMPSPLLSWNFMPLSEPSWKLPKLLPVLLVPLTTVTSPGLTVV